MSEEYHISLAYFIAILFFATSHFNPPTCLANVYVSEACGLTKKSAVIGMSYKHYQGTAMHSHVGFLRSFRFNFNIKQNITFISNVPIVQVDDTLQK